MATKRNRLDSYRKHATDGTLDKIREQELSNNPEERAQQIANLTGLPVSVVTEKILLTDASNASTQNDSVQTVNDILSVLTAQGAKNAGRQPPLPNVSQRIRSQLLMAIIDGTCKEFGARTIFTCLEFMNEDGETATPVSVFNPHFANCGCDDCKATVAYAKNVVNKFDEVGRIKK